MWEEVEVFNSDTSEYRRVYRIVSCPPGYALERDEERPNNDNCKVACPRYIAMKHSCTHQEKPPAVLYKATAYRAGSGMYMFNVMQSSTLTLVVAHRPAILASTGWTR